MCVCVCVCVCVCARVCVRACVRACVCVYYVLVRAVSSSGCTISSIQGRKILSLQYACHCHMSRISFGLCAYDFMARKDWLHFSKHEVLYILNSQFFESILPLFDYSVSFSGNTL